jgi:hypothetical protein
VKPFVLRRDEELKATVDCTDCNSEARALWCDNDGNIPLCDPCVEARRVAYRIKYAKEV